MKGIILDSVVPVRREASEASEMLTQLLFAETVDVLEEQPRWIRVRNDADGQTGWIDFKMLRKLTDAEALQVAQSDRTSRVKLPIAYVMDNTAGQPLPLTAGTALPDYSGGEFRLLGNTYTIDPNAVAAWPQEMNFDNLMKNVLFFLNIPYLWGGKNALGMDCSGFTQILFSLFGRPLLRNASEQATQGKEVRSLADAQAGDLLFFDHEDGKISHVGIFLEEGHLIHCSGRVKTDKLDEKGIFSEEQGCYTHHLVQIRRY